MSDKRMRFQFIHLFLASVAVSAVLFVSAISALSIISIIGVLIISILVLVRSNVPVRKPVR